MFETRNLKTLAEDYYDEYMDELDAFDQEFNREISEEEFEFGDNLFSFFQEIIDDNELTEEFRNQNQLTAHFKKHCLRNIKGRVSKPTNVYYDFINEVDYSSHEDAISKLTVDVVKNKTDLFIDDLYDADKIIKAFRKFFEGNQTLVFGLACGFHNNVGVVRICLHSFATNYTTNYMQNTIDFLVQAPDNKTISLYAIDARYLETKINNEIEKIPEAAIIKINH